MPKMLIWQFFMARAPFIARHTGKEDNDSNLTVHNKIRLFKISLNNYVRCDYLPPTSDV